MGVWVTAGSPTVTHAVFLVLLFIDGRNEFMNGRRPLDGLSPCLLWGLDHQSSDLFNSFTIQAKSIAKGLGPQLVYRGWSVSPTVALATSTPGSHVTIESMSLARWGGV